MTDNTELMALQDERDRIERERLAIESENAKREADKEHKTKIHNDIKDALQKIIDNGSWQDNLIKAIVIAMAKGEIPHVTIKY